MKFLSAGHVSGQHLRLRQEHPQLPVLPQLRPEGHDRDVLVDRALPESDPLRSSQRRNVVDQRLSWTILPACDPVATTLVAKRFGATLRSDTRGRTRSTTSLLLSVLHSAR
jgi:hypothetical protein